MGRGNEYVYSGAKYTESGIGEIGEARNRARDKRAKDRLRKVTEREQHVKRSKRNQSYLYDDYEDEYSMEY